MDSINFQLKNPTENFSYIKNILTRGFIFIGLAMIFLAFVWFYISIENQELIDEILEKQEELSAVFNMREAARTRHIIVLRMSLMKDVFEIYDERSKLESQGELFVKSRNNFFELQNEDHSEEMKIWNRAIPAIRKGQFVQNEIARLMILGDDKAASDLVLNKLAPIQDSVMSHLTDLVEAEKKYIETKVEETSQRNHWALIIFGSLITWSLFWCAFIAIRMIQRTASIERSLHEARLDAQDADKQKSQFLANMSHEIRTPLTAILGFSETLYNDKNKDENESQSYLATIIRNGKHLHQLINDILDLSKIEANQLFIESIPTSYVSILLEIESLMRERAKDKHLKLELVFDYPIPQSITSDPTRLKQIVLNLCSNAIKFTAKGSVSIKVSYEKKSNVIKFTVNDTGIGMSQEQLSGLFRPFKQADSSTTRKYGGTGLGLYISKQLAEKLGGKLLVTSIHNIGSSFTVSIDAGKTNEDWFNSEGDLFELSNKLNEINIPELKGKILLAEDNKDNQQLIAMLIKNTGANVEVVENGKLAVDRAREESFDLILMDMQMPVMGGIEAIGLLRANKCTTPIATLTANAMKDDIDKYELAGATAFLTKPINHQEFYSVLNQYLTRPTTEEVDDFIKQEYDGIKDLIENYTNRLSETGYRIQRLLDAKDWVSVMNEIHQLKGTGGAFGYPAITNQCIVIEEKYLNKDFDFATKLITSLANHIIEIYENRNTQN